MLSFSEFILEKLGKPEALTPYENLIFKRVWKHAQYWISRKGYANYNTEVDIPWLEIKEEITDEEFKAFPIEDITLHVSFNVFKDLGKGYTSTFVGWQHSFNQRKRIEDVAHWMRSKSGLVKKALSLEMMAGFEVTKDVTINFNFLKKQLKYTIRHELLHAYENMKDPNYDRNSVWLGVWVNAMEVDKKCDKSLWVSRFWQRFYFAGKHELGARVTEADKESRKSKTIEDVLFMLGDLNAEDIIKNVKKDLKITEDSKYYKEFGKLFVKVYKMGCKDYHAEPQEKFLKLQDKDFGYIARYFEPMFRRRFDYFKRKIAKRMTMVDVEV